MKKLLICISIITSVCAFSQEYKVSLIPDSLIKDADAVHRFENLSISIRGIDKAIIKHKWAITILNESADKFASYYSYYSKLDMLSDVSGKLFDADGKLIRKIKKSDVSDVSVSDEAGSLASDNREKSFSFYHKIYPFTVEFEDEEELKGILYFPQWNPMRNTGAYSVQQASFTIEAPADYNLRFKQQNYPSQPKISHSGNTTTYNWEVKNAPPIQNEIWSPSPDEYLTSVSIAPSKFSIGGYIGDMSTWEGYGKFQVSLNNGRSELPINIKQDVHKIADGLPTWEKKVTALYEYLQKNTRYISIQLGIGGWQPLEAKFVAEKKYGDCKALSNYMVSILKEAGIPAYYVIIKSGSQVRKGLFEDFPAAHFNHIVCCVPNNKDTIWLECTSQTESAGYMGSFTGNRKALLITDNGGVVVSTPKYPAEANKSITKVIAIVSENGAMNAEVDEVSTGLSQEKSNYYYHEATQKQRDEFYNNIFDFPTYKIENIKYKETKGRIPAMDEHFTVASENFATITGKRLFIHPNVFQQTSRLPTAKPRKLPIVYPNSYLDIDSISITIPAGYSPEALPKDVKIDNKFGSYSISYKVKSKVIEVIRTVKRSENTFPATDYDDMVKFYEDMHKADKAKMVFVKG